MNTAKHIFSPGRAYALDSVSSPEEYLEIALRAERYIAKFQREDAGGIYWAADAQAVPNLKLSTGSSGVLYFYMMLAKVTGEEKYERIVQKALHYLLVHWKEHLPEQAKDASYSLFGRGLFGIGGAALVLLTAYDVYGKDEIRQALAEFGDYYLQCAIRDEKGARWTGSTAYGLDGSIVLVLIGIYERFGDPAVRQLLEEAGKWFLSHGKEHPDGGVEFNDGVGINGVELRGDFGSPNFELGTAGAAFVLARLSQALEDNVYLEAAKGAAVYLESIAVKQRKGYLVPYRVNDNEPPIFYLGGCHGPGGTSKLFYQLYQMTGNRHYFDQIVELTDGLESLGAPEFQSPGFWNNISMCCGHAALVQAFLGLYQVNGEERFRELAIRCGNVLLGEREDMQDGSTSWTIAFERIHPDRFSTDYTYNNGAAGIAAALLQLYLNETGQFSWKRLPDDPYPEKAGSVKGVINYE